MADSTPIVVNHHGANGGSATANSQAVTTALKSPRCSASGLPRAASIAVSATSATAVAITRLIRMPQPKNQTSAATPGTMAYSTRRMT